MPITEIFNAYGGDIIALVFAILSVAFSFLAQWRIGRVGKSITGLTEIKADTAEGKTEIAEAAQAVPAEINQEVKDMKFQTGYSVSLEVNLNAGQASSQLVVTTSDGKTLSGDEAVKQLQELLTAVKGA